MKPQSDCMVSRPFDVCSLAFFVCLCILEIHWLWLGKLANYECKFVNLYNVRCQKSQVKSNLIVDFFPKKNEKIIEKLTTFWMLSVIACMPINHILHYDKWWRKPNSTRWQIKWKWRNEFSVVPNQNKSTVGNCNLFHFSRIISCSTCQQNIKCMSSQHHCFTFAFLQRNYKLKWWLAESNDINRDLHPKQEREKKIESTTIYAVWYFTRYAIVFSGWFRSRRELRGLFPVKRKTFQINLLKLFHNFFFPSLSRYNIISNNIEFAAKKKPYENGTLQFRIQWFSTNAREKISNTFYFICLLCKRKRTKAV